MISIDQILLVDDSPLDTELTLDALNTHRLANEVVSLRDGADALDYLYRRGAFADRPPGNPAVVLLDLKMPKVDGTEVLRQMKSDPQLRSIPVVVMTSSREDRDLHESYHLGANAYVVKPVNFHEFIDAVKSVGGFWAMLNMPAPASATERP
jgi:CheY-like chemotaxis protein